MEATSGCWPVRMKVMSLGRGVSVEEFTVRRMGVVVSACMGISLRCV